MYDQEHDAIVEISQDIAHVRAFSAQAQQWIKTHVILEQVESWNGNTLAVAPHYIGDLIAGMLADGLKVASVRGSMIEHRGQCSSVLFMAQVSQNCRTL
jgi:hypothetical protein